MDAQVSYAVATCSLGLLLVARSELGLCAVFLGDERAVLVRDLQRQFPAAALLAADNDLRQLMQRVQELIEVPGGNPALTGLQLDVRGTAFQQRVWSALAEVPAGRTVTYLELARRISAPKAFRAVAQACGANTLAVLIPCHRVVRSDGSLAGYRWGVNRKRALLSRERLEPEVLPGRLNFPDSVDQ